MQDRRRAIVMPSPVEWAIVVFMVGAIVQYGRLIERVDSLTSRLARVEVALDRR